MWIVDMRYASEDEKLNRARSPSNVSTYASFFFSFPCVCHCIYTYDRACLSKLFVLPVCCYDKFGSFSKYIFTNVLRSTCLSIFFRFLEPVTYLPNGIKA